MSTNTDTYAELLNCGPMTLDSNKVTLEMRRDGVSRFMLSYNNRGDKMKGVGRQKCVYYIEGKHDPKTVIETFFEANPHVREKLTDWAIHHRIATRMSEEWAEASHDIFAPFDREWNNGNGKPTDQECPMCGEEITCHLRQHLPCDGVE